MNDAVALATAATCFVCLCVATVANDSEREIAIVAAATCAAAWLLVRAVARDFGTSAACATSTIACVVASAVGGPGPTPAFAALGVLSEIRRS